MTPIEAQTTGRRSAPKRWGTQRILIVVIAVLGIGILLYPTAAAWFSDRFHANEISGYADSVKSLAPEKSDAILESARRYNAELPAGPLRDPYTLNENGEKEAIGSGSEAYKETLEVDAEGVMGTLSIPSIKVNLPIFHGTDEDVLAKGVGHLFGSSLPIGGVGTHSVLTAHSGFVNATLFNNLHDVKLGDVFSTSVLNQTIYYKVDSIKTVRPGETESLRQVKGQDYMTLITCTPTGVNSHRLLVRGVRIPAPAADAGTGQVITSEESGPGFPWWAVVFLGATVSVVVLTRPRQAKVAPAELPLESEN